MSDGSPAKRPPPSLESGDMARGPQLRVGVSQALKEHVEQTAKRLGYPSASELVREAILFRLAMIHLQETGDAKQAEEILRKLASPER